MVNLILLHEQGVHKWDKKFGKALEESTLDTILGNFLKVNPIHAVNLARCFLVKLKEVQELFQSQTSYHAFGSSILFCYDYENLASIDWATTNPVRVRLIDFAHVFPGNGILDENYLFGVSSLVKLFDTFIQRNWLHNCLQTTEFIMIVLYMIWIRNKGPKFCC